MTLTPLRRHLAAAAVLSLTLGFGACASDETPADESPSSDTASPEPSEDAEPSEEPADGEFLTEDELMPAVLTPDDLPGGFVLEPEEEDDEDSEAFAGTCLEEVGTLTDQPEFDADGEAEASYVLDGDAGQSSVKSQVQSYADQGQVETAIALFSEVVGTCSEASGTDPDGTTYDLEVLSDQTVSLAGVDEQARVAISGTFTSGELELPVSIGYNVARIANNIVVIATLDIGEAGDGIVPQTDVIAQISVDRLAEITG
ncbi:hypothetical protein [Nocardioides sp.]|uniref:hypothetical protein n=1 Tax=Nocardioides sp. TaxID=35761 RepID=UPI002B26FEE4|nr:hypothetical protein [Nocardioides sp.]